MKLSPWPVLGIVAAAALLVVSMGVPGPPAQTAEIRHFVSFELIQNEGDMLEAILALDTTAAVIDIAIYGDEVVFGEVIEERPGVFFARAEPLPDERCYHATAEVVLGAVPPPGVSAGPDVMGTTGPRDSNAKKSTNHRKDKKSGNPDRHHRKGKHTKHTKAPKPAPPTTPTPPAPPDAELVLFEVRASNCLELMCAEQLPR